MLFYTTKHKYTAIGISIELLVVESYPLKDFSLPILGFNHNIRRKEHMSRTKKALIFILALLFATLGPALALNYWSRTIQHSVTVIGIIAELYQPNFDGYAQQIVAADLVDDKIALTILDENFYNIWLNVSWTSNAEGLAIDITGQYFDVFWYHSGNPGGVQHFDPVGTPFQFDNGTGQTIDKTKMMWNPIVEADDPIHGGCLVLSFAFDTELVTTPGDYTVDLLFEMGFVE